MIRAPWIALRGPGKPYRAVRTSWAEDAAISVLRHVPPQPGRSFPSAVREPRLIGGFVRRMFSLWMCLVVLAVSGISAQRASEGATPGEAFLGVWSGTWEGGGRTGGIELTLEKAKDGSIGGRVS